MFYNWGRRSNIHLTPNCAIIKALLQLPAVLKFNFIVFGDLFKNEGSLILGIQHRTKNGSFTKSFLFVFIQMLWVIYPKSYFFNIFPTSD